MYVAIKRFVDLTDDDHIYNAGDMLSLIHI